MTFLIVVASILEDSIKCHLVLVRRASMFPVFTFRFGVSQEGDLRVHSRGRSDFTSFTGDVMIERDVLGYPGTHQVTNPLFHKIHLAYDVLNSFFIFFIFLSIYPYNF
jgi:hypothetical protein